MQLEGTNEQKTILYANLSGNIKNHASKLNESKDNYWTRNLANWDGKAVERTQKGLMRLIVEIFWHRKNKN